MKVNILDLIDFKQVDTLLEGFNKNTGFVTAILDLDGNVLSKSGWRQICTEFHRINPETSKKCSISDIVLARKMEEDGQYHYYECLNGLVDVAVPIVINGEHIANLFSGQFFFEEPDRMFFKEQAKRHGFDEKKYLEALDKVPIVSKERVNTAMDFLLKMTLLISETTFQKLEQMQLHDAVLKSEERFETFMEQTPVYAYIKDGSLKHVFSNKKVFELEKLNQCRQTADTAKEIFDPDLAEYLENADKKILSGQTNRIELEYKVNIGGQNRWLNDIKFALTLTDGTRGVGGLAFDITERKQAEEEQLKLEKRLQQAQKIESIGTLAGGVAHDFNNMLGVILGHAELIMEQLDPALPIYTDLKEIRQAAQRSADLTRQLLAFARKQTREPRELDLNQTLEGVLQMLRRLIGAGINLAWLPGKELALVNMDPSQLDQILANLCVNARDAIADVGRVTIETGTAVFDDDYCSEHAGFLPGEFVLLAVSDDGCGMDKETQQLIFEPFFTTKEQGKGTGLGLATVYGIVKQNNGFINIYSEPGQGTAFKIYLPRYIRQAEHIREEGSAKVDRRGDETILLVEDEPSILRMTTTMLERLGYKVIAANSPGEAIYLASERSDHINLLMTDVVMPEMNGRDLAENILLIYPNLKRLFMSGYTANVIAHHGVLDKGVNFIQKPFSIKDLAAKIREVLNSESK